MCRQSKKRLKQKSGFLLLAEILLKSCMTKLLPLWPQNLLINEISFLHFYSTEKKYFLPFFKIFISDEFADSRFLFKQWIKRILMKLEPWLKSTFDWKERLVEPFMGSRILERGLFLLAPKVSWRKPLPAFCFVSGKHVVTYFNLLKATQGCCSRRRTLGNLFGCCKNAG